jgi:hypothetical protein
MVVVAAAVVEAGRLLGNDRQFQKAENPGPGVVIPPTWRR